jgi:hypothetical protein
MANATTTEVKTRERAAKTSNNAKSGDKKPSGDSYVLPVVGVHVPATAVNVGFWGGLVGAAALGVVDPPLAVLVGAGVLVARHARKP